MSGRNGLKVLHVGKYYPPVRGGMEKVLELLCETEGKSVDTRALVVNNRPITVHENIRGVPVTRVASFGVVRSVSISPTFPFWLRHYRSDVVVIHEPNTLGLFCHFLTRPSGRLVVWFHSEVVRQRWLYMLHRPFLRRALRRADRVVVSSPKLVDHARELQEFRPKCAVIPFGIDAQRLALTPAIAHRVNRLRKQLCSPIVLFVGRMIEYKGVDILLHALRGLKATAVLVGTGPLLSFLKNLATELGIQEQVVFCGEVEENEVVALYNACDVFVLPSVSRNEAFGIVQLEAMACGKPVVSTNLPSGVPWVNRHGETGLVIPPGDVEALREALARLLADPELRNEMGKRGQERVAAEFTPERMASRTMALYREILTERGGVPMSLDQPASREKVRIS